MKLTYKGKKRLFILLAIVIIILANILTHVITNRVQMKENDMVLVDKSKVIEYLETQFDYIKFLGVELAIENDHIDDIDVSKFTEGQLDGMLKGSDPYANYYTKEEYQEFIKYNIEENYPDNIIAGRIDNIGYIKIEQFLNDSSEKFNEELDELLDKDIKGLVLDLRNSPGGSKDSLIAIGSRLTKKKEIGSLKEKKGNSHKLLTEGKNIDLPIVVLINENTKGEAELLAEGIRDSSNKLIGNKTYGKEYSQEIVEMSNGDKALVSVYENILANGERLTSEGIEPDIYLVDNKYPKDLGIHFLDEDIQLKKALEILNK